MKTLSTPETTRAVRFRVDTFAFPRNHYPVVKAMYRVPAFHMAPKLAAAGLGPDAVTGLSFFAGIGAAALFAWTGEWGAALVLLHISLLLDYADGEVARWMGRSSLRGAWLEAGLDKVQVIAVVAGLGAAGTSALAWPLAFAAVTSFLLAQGLMVHRKILVQSPLAELRSSAPSSADSVLRVWVVAAWRETALNYGFWLWVLSVGLWVGGPDIALWALAVYGWGRAFLDIVVGALRAGSIDRRQNVQSQGGSAS